MLLFAARCRRRIRHYIYAFRICFSPPLFSGFAAAAAMPPPLLMMTLPLTLTGWFTPPLTLLMLTMSFDVSMFRLLISFFDIFITLIFTPLFLLRRAYDADATPLCCRGLRFIIAYYITYAFRYCRYAIDAAIDAYAAIFISCQIRWLSPLFTLWCRDAITLFSDAAITPLMLTMPRCRFQMLLRFQLSLMPSLRFAYFIIRHYLRH